MEPMQEAAAEHRAALVRFVLPRVKDHAAAEDIVHDVLLRAWERQSQLRDETKLSAWLYQMTRFAIADHYRAQRPSVELPEDLIAPENEDRVVQELAQCLTPLIAQLPEEYRLPLEMNELEGRTQQEVAEHLGLSLSGAKSRVQRARTKLQESLLRCCRVELDHRGSVMAHDCVSNCGCSRSVS
ncbi:MAG TPA: RNA polymerase sigma factor SigZ [Thermoanaerobaculia bacterium]